MDIHEKTNKKQKELQTTIRELIALKQIEVRKLQDEMEALQMVSDVLSGAADGGRTTDTPSVTPTNGAAKGISQMLP